MEKFDFNSKKYIILLVVICLLFFILIIKAFDYLPETQSNNNIQNNNQVVVDNNYTEPAENDYSSADEDSENNKTGEIVYNESDILNETPSGEKIEEIKAPEGVGVESESADMAENAETVKTPELTPQEKAKNALEKADKFKKEGNLKEALTEYQKIQDLVSDKDLVASSYEGIANLYAISKRYGTALSYAIKAYNLSPTSAREILLARLYYKTGDLEKATKRVNNVLHRDFSEDR